MLVGLIDIIHDMTIDHENVFITIVVVIEEIDAPAEIVIGNFSYTRVMVASAKNSPFWLP